MRILAVVLVLTLGAPLVARADDDVALRRTTPRAALAIREHTVVIGIPSGRAWGVESALHPIAATERIVVRLSVTDDAVREAFVRVAYYASATGRTRQLAVSDSAPVRGGEHALVVVDLDRPPGAVAYRVRLLGRLVPGARRSTDEAVAARSGWLAGVDSRFSRLLP